MAFDFGSEAWQVHNESAFPTEDASELCGDCDQYHVLDTSCPFEECRRLQDFEEEEMDRAEYARHDRRLFG
jgi:hypothetical protein